jgi:hypothetical protein
MMAVPAESGGRPSAYGTAGQPVWVHIGSDAHDAASWVIERLTLSEGQVVWGPALPIAPARGPGDLLGFPLPARLATGYYRLRPLDQPDFAHPLPVNGEGSEDAPVAVVRPLLTEWSYAVDGFYPSRGERELTLRARLSGALRRLLLRERPRFPMRPSVRLDQPYRRNWLWARESWHPVHGLLRGCWNEEIISAWPLYLLLDSLGVRYRVYADTDLHFGTLDLERHDRLLLYGADGITGACFSALQRFAARDGARLVLWACQGLGYREYALSEDGSVLSHVATRGRFGMWGERLGETDPAWDEGAVFGFRFPTPEGPRWWLKAPYRTIEVVRPDHWLIQGAQLAASSFIYEKRDADGVIQPGLIRFGGEFFEPAHPDATVVARIPEGDTPLIGIGEFRNVVTFSPTYWPAYWLWHYPRHPEVPALLRAALSSS